MRPRGRRTDSPATVRDRETNWFAWGLAAIVAVGLIVRLVTALARPDLPVLSDPSFFRLQGVLLARGHGFADPFVFAENGRVLPTAFHPPLFSVLLGAVNKIGFDSVSAARIASCMVGTVTVLLVGLVGKEVGGRRVGLLAAAIAALTPNLWVPDGALTSEGLAAALVAATLLCAYRLNHNPRHRTAIGLGVLIGLAGLTRPETLLLSVLLVIPLASRLQVAPRQRVGIVVVAGLATFVVIAPWMVRSATLFERPVLFSTNGQALIGFANCPGTYGGPTLGSWRMDCPLQNFQIGIAAPRRTQAADEAQIAADRADEGMRYIRQNAGELVTKVVWARIGRTWSAFHPLDAFEAGINEGKTRTQTRVGVLAVWSSLGFGVIGARALARSKTAPLWPLLAPFVVTTAVSVFAYGTPRFRVISEPSIAVLAALGVDAIHRHRLNRRHRESVPATAAVNPAP